MRVSSGSGEVAVKRTRPVRELEEPDARQQVRSAVPCRSEDPPPIGGHVGDIPHSGGVEQGQVSVDHEPGGGSRHRGGHRQVQASARIIRDLGSQIRCQISFF